MSINERIIQAVTPVIPVCVPDIYRPDEGEAAEEYCTFNYTEIPDSFGDNAPEAIRYLVQVHYYAPWKTVAGKSSNTMGARRALRRALFDAEFTYPTVDNASDGDSQHFVFECEYAGGEV